MKEALPLTPEQHDFEIHREQPRLDEILPTPEKAPVDPRVEIGNGDVGEVIEHQEEITKRRREEEKRRHQIN